MFPFLICSWSLYDPDTPNHLHLLTQHYTTTTQYPTCLLPSANGSPSTALPSPLGESTLSAVAARALSARCAFLAPSLLLPLLLPQLHLLRLPLLPRSLPSSWAPKMLIQLPPSQHTSSYELVKQWNTIYPLRLGFFLLSHTTCTTMAKKK